MVEKVHFIGVGGIGMSALAHFALVRGVAVSGSDLSMNARTEALKQLGATIYEGHVAANVPQGATVVFSTDIKEDNPERLKALKDGLTLIHRSDYLARIMKGKKQLLVSGSHGKTTTTTLLAHTLMVARLDPSFFLGGVSVNYGSNAHSGKGEYFVAEADESDGTHLRYAPHAAIVTNIDNDHLAHYGSIEAIETSLIDFLHRVKQPSFRVFCKDDPRLSKVVGKSYGFHKDSDLRILSWIPCEGGGKVCLKEKETQKEHVLFLPLFGQHNALNCAAVFLLAQSLGVHEECIAYAFSSFLGVRRRLENVCHLAHIDVFDDYAHHPTEVKATLQAVKAAYPHRRLVALFQPHRPSRMKHVFSDFAEAFTAADVILLTDLYLSSESSDFSVSNDAFYSFIQSTHSQIPTRYIPRSSLAQDVAKEVFPDDVVVFMGAGDSTKAAKELSTLLKVV